MTNVVLVVMDTARAGDVQDESALETLSGMADSGTEFTRAIANAPWTLPSHASLFSGRHPSEHGAHAAHKGFDAAPTLAELLSDGGYHTAAISNNTWISGEFGFDRGFDEFVATWQLFQDAVDFGDVAQQEMTLSGKLRGIARKFSGNPIKNVANLLYGQFFRKRTDDGAKRTNEIIGDRLPRWRDRDEPLFLFVNYLEPHLEYDPPEEIARRRLPDGISYEEALAVNQDAWAYVTGERSMTDRDFEALRALYRAEIEYLDGRLGELRDQFRAAGLLENTVFIVTGDHGENIGDHGLMDHQYSLHQTLLHVPLVIDGPGFPRGERIDTPVQLVDLFSTILDVADVDAGATSGTGESLCHPGTISQDRTLFSEYVAPQPPVETLRERYDCTRDLATYDRRLWAAQTADAKLISGSDGSETLYDLTAEPLERADCSEQQPALLESLRKELEAWKATLPEPEHEAAEVDRQTKRRLEELGYLQ